MLVVGLGRCCVVVFWLLSLSASTFFRRISVTIIIFPSHGETFDNNQPWESVSICICQMSVLFVLLHFVSNPMNWLSFLGCFDFWFHLDRVLMFFPLVDGLHITFDCWLYPF